MSLPRGKYCTLELGEHEVPNLRRLIALNEDLNPWLVLVSGAYREEVCVRPLGIFTKDRILDRIETGLSSDNSC